MFYVLFISFICKRFNGLIIPFIWLHWAYLWLAALIYDFVRGPEGGVATDWNKGQVKPETKRNEVQESKVFHDRASVAIRIRRGVQVALSWDSS